MPHPPSTLQHFSLIVQSNSAVLNILMCDFLFQVTSSFVIALDRILIKEDVSRNLAKLGNYKMPVKL